MGLMALMEGLGTHNIPIIAAFFIGLMTAISPCPLAANITAIAYASKRLDNSRHTLLIGFLYTLGRMFTYILVAMLIVSFGINIQSISFFLQKNGERLLGPLLLAVGFVMLDIVKFNLKKSSKKLDHIKEKLGSKGFLGSFLLGVLFAFAFCPFSAVLFFGMLIPVAIKAGDSLFIPAVFAFATGLPVIIFSFILVKSVSKLGQVMRRVQAFEYWMRKTVAVVFIITGIYYVYVIYI